MDDSMQYYMVKAFQKFCKRAIHNYSIDLDRKKTVQKEKLFSDLSPGQEICILATTDEYEDGDPVYKLLQTGQVIRGWHLVCVYNNLPVLQQQIIRLYYYSELKDWEIGEILHIPRRTVNARRRNALCMMRGQLEVLSLGCETY